MILMHSFFKCQSVFSIERTNGDLSTHPAENKCLCSTLLPKDGEAPQSTLLLCMYVVTGDPPGPEELFE